MEARTVFGLSLVVVALVLWWLSNRQNSAGDRWLDRAEKIGSLVMAIAGLGLLLFPALGGSDAGDSEAGSVQIDGDFVDSVLINGGNVESLVINEGDSAEERERKRLEREYIILAFASRAASALDAWLVSVDAALESDDFAERLETVRQELAPVAAENLSRAYDTLLAESMVNGLRVNLASEPLPDLEDEFALLLVAESDVTASDFLFLLDQLEEADQAAETLLADLDAVVAEDGICQAADWEAYRFETIDLSHRRLGSRSATAYYAAQAVVAAVDSDVVEATDPFDQLQILQPAGLMKGDDLDVAIVAEVDKAEGIVDEQGSLVTRAEALRDGDLTCLAAIDDELVVDDGDTWDEVVAKAISLRDLGRYGEAVEAFERYRQLFSPTDPTAEAYAATARQFTERVAVGEMPTKAIYVFRVQRGSAADGIVVESDIIIGINDRDVMGQEGFENVMATRDPAVVTRLVVLRLADGRFDRLELELPPADVLGLGVMSI